jgi:hypothetical protein
MNRRPHMKMFLLLFAVALGALALAFSGTGKADRVAGWTWDDGVASSRTAGWTWDD